MESLSKTDSLRQALQVLGTATGRELANFTGLPIDRVGALLACDIRKGRVVRGWNGKIRCYGMAGTLQDTGSVVGNVCSGKSKGKVRYLPLGVTNPAFRALAQKAVALEQQFKYSSAMSAWLAAADASMLLVNEQWCLSRAMFCESAQSKGWGGRP
ncbi:TPA: ANR family transcriptional regulator [Yersinia enterocolitica]|uniref:ANR family transcriptional regulator n=1 Tax=Yersinia rohdei TaxID=29485 RepID=UPI0011A2EB56|nr:ANR family transcriptional regulator [Yersinia rohdei]HDL6527739.1 ANR family transcriptional regulator [Yersinia enterocolitica]HDL6639770.1 ANR family transcriptional regulator [Yersinia enterocolitica]HDL6658210.1 ANR family transcriptional regulator [Yersinia enterocolitica]HDL6665814.1 ANR family transcriptional regulator [Yersinia enterocolitica]HDL6679462.1 ANR family transcriptional regulator [Yersinia enterocolitica]